MLQVPYVIYFSKVHYMIRIGIYMIHQRRLWKKKDRFLNENVKQQTNLVLVPFSI